MNLFRGNPKKTLNFVCGSFNNIIMSAQIFLNGITVEQLADALKPLLFNQNQQTQNTTESDLLTREETCKLLSINKTSLWKHTRNGKLKSYGIGNRVYYKKSEVLEAIKPLNK